MTSILAVLIFSVIPQEVGVVRDYVDVVERNRVYDENAVLVFEQLIWYTWSEADGRFQVRAWRLDKSPAIVPLKTPEGYVSVWMDGDVPRYVLARSRVESWTQHDPELAERAYLDNDKRKGLSSPKKRK